MTSPPRDPGDGDNATPPAPAPADNYDADACPRLVRRARLRWDAVRNAHVVLVPEGVLMLTRTAAEVLELCDGVRTVRAITETLAARYPTAPVARDTAQLLARLTARGLLEDARARP